MGGILQRVDSLRPDELIWLHDYMTGCCEGLQLTEHTSWRQALRQLPELVMPESESCG